MIGARQRAGSMISNGEDNSLQLSVIAVRRLRRHYVGRQQPFAREPGALVNKRISSNPTNLASGSLTPLHPKFTCIRANRGSLVKSLRPRAPVSMNKKILLAEDDNDMRRFL